MMAEHSGRYQWYRQAGTHLWRTFFRYEADHQEADTEAKRHTFRLCRSALAEMPAFERKFIKTYFSSQWGKDVETVEDYAAKSNFDSSVLWMIIHKANRRIFELANLIEPKEKD